MSFIKNSDIKIQCHSANDQMKFNLKELLQACKIHLHTADALTEILTYKYCPPESSRYISEVVIRRSVRLLGL